MSARLAPAHFGASQQGGREGDRFVLLVETTGPGGVFCEIGRACVLGKATLAMKGGKRIGSSVDRECRAGVCYCFSTIRPCTPALIVPSLRI
jgi:hypothetical protein